jgi:hypothetical protein
VKRILDPAFRYRPSYDTDVRATFERARREQEPPQDQAKDEQRESASRLVRAAALALRR